jgi:hypothetical protein
MRKFFVLAFALAVAALAGAVAGEAQQPIVINLPITSVAGLPVASVGFPVQNQDFKLVDKPGDFTAEADDDHGAAFGNVTVRASPSPFLFISAKAFTANGDADVNVGPVQLEYSMVIIGPPGGFLGVPVDIRAFGEEKINADERGTAFLDDTLLGSTVTITGNGIVELKTESELTASLTNPKQVASFDYDDSLLLDPFTIYTVIVTADIGDVSVSGTGNIDFTVFVDPQFIIGGDDPGAYSLEFSPGIGNGPIGGVPEPSTWAMMLLGFAGLSFAGYCRTRVRSATANGAASR